MHVPSAHRRWPLALAGLLIVGFAAVAYRNSFAGAFVFDDVPSILGNPSIRHLWPPWASLFPGRPDLTVSGRPAVNFSLALNYALSGERVGSYHALNLLIHGLAALLLFGVVRRTLLLPVCRSRLHRDATLLALTVAVLWAVHPLQTEAVTYIAQRTESLMGLFYLLTLYACIRYGESGTRFWAGLAVTACLLAVASKEVAATAPVVVLLYDRCFLAGSFRGAWRERRGLYLGLAATWIPLLGFLRSTNWTRGGAAGFAGGITPGHYLLIQGRAIVYYLRLAVWPHPLVFDYGTVVASPTAAVFLPGLWVALAVAATAAAVWRGQAAGFLGAWFFLILAPSSSVVPVATQTMAEHRLYLPLAAVIAGAVLGLYRWAGPKSLVLWLVPALACTAATAERNHTYRNAETLWADTVRQLPNNERARANLGAALLDAGQIPEAIEQLQNAVRLYPASVPAQNNLGLALARSGDVEASLPHFAAVAQLTPNSAEAHNNLGTALARCGRYLEAGQEFATALRLRPDDAAAQRNLRRLGTLGEPPAPLPRPEQSEP